ncbi:MAG: amidohydrolase [Bacteroidales bacterium]|jgi:amidohydrolase|nr:amidohydrolase [Bacteroidales bacterium]
MSLPFKVDPTIITLRKEIHQNPELSGNEKNTALRIKNYIERFNPDNIVENIGGNGLLVTFKGQKPGKTIMFRADIDALPIHEESEFLHKSINKNIAHLCGHDGHSAILANTIRLVSENRPTSGNIMFLFQPAEETGQGAINVLNDKNFVNPDFIFGIHNIPGFKENQILLKPGIIAAASKGMIIQLYGKTSHASEPEKGISPAIAMSEIITYFNEVNLNKSTFNSLILTTVVYARLGEIAFGTSPGYAEVMITLRSFSDSDMDWLIRISNQKIHEITSEQQIEYEVSYVEEFPSTENNADCINMLTSIAKSNDFDFCLLENPFKWSEDFGHFTRNIPGALIGIGAGIDHPNLHNPSYDFPDNIIQEASRFLFTAGKHILE